MMKYKLFSEDYVFDTGRNAKNEQIIIGILAPNIIVLQFTDEGNLHNVNKFPATVISDDIHPYDTYGYAFDDLLMQVKSQLGFVSAPVSMREFFLEQDGIGIQELPDHYLDYLNNKDNEDIYDLESKESYESLIVDWRVKNNFVFYWGNDYYIDGVTGEIESS